MLCSCTGTHTEVQRGWTVITCNHVRAQSTSVVSGSGKGVVVATGAATYIACLALALPRGSAMTAFDWAVRRVVYLFIAFIIIMVPLVIVLSGTTACESPFQPVLKVIFLSCYFLS